MESVRGKRFLSEKPVSHIRWRVDFNASLGFRAECSKRSGSEIEIDFYSAFQSLSRPIQLDFPSNEELGCNQD